MSIQQQLNDAAFLAQSGRPEGALTLLLLAIAGSSKKVFPDGTLSRKPLKKEGAKPDRMRDGEAFSLYLGGRLREIIFSDIGCECGVSGVNIPFRGEQHDIGELLYKYYRCQLVHEGGLQADVHFVPPQAEPQIKFGLTGRRIESIGLSFNNDLVMDFGWLDLLYEAVFLSPINRDIFNTEFTTVIAKSGRSYEEEMLGLQSRYKLPGGPFAVTARIFRMFSVGSIERLTDQQLKDEFSSRVLSGEIQAASMVCFSAFGLAERPHQLKDTGVALIREYDSLFEIAVLK